jgi:TPR repeat protein
MGYPAATFALATAYFLGDDVQQNHAKAEVLFFQAYNKSVFWAARGLSSLYSDEFSDLFDEQKASEWASKFDAETKKD